MKKYFTFCIFIASFFISICFAEEQLIVEPDQGRAPLLSLLQQTHSTLQLVMYGLTDESLIDALIAAKNKGKMVQVLLEAHPYKSKDENQLALQQLTDAHILLHFPPPRFKFLHQKTVLVDQNKALVMTFNFTHSSFKNQRNFALLVTDPTEVQEIQHIFNADWDNKKIAVADPRLVWSPDNSRQKIIDFIDSAHTSIKVYAQGLTDYEIIGALARAARAGIQVQVLMSAPQKNRSKRQWHYLRKAGVAIHTSHRYYIHAKVIIIDNQRALLGSLNFTPPSINDNRELSIITQSPDVVGTLVKTFEEDYESE